MRNKFTFKIENSDLFIKKLILISKDFSHSCCLDSNNTSYRKPPYYNNYSFIFALDYVDIIKSDSNSFKKLKDFHAKYSDWMFGYLSYDLKNETHQLSSNNESSINDSNLCFFIPKYVFILKENSLIIEALASESETNTMFNKILSQNIGKTNAPKIKLKSRESKKEYLKKIKTIKSYIQRGDIYEMNYCQEFFAENIKCIPQNIFIKLNSISQSPFSCFLNIDDLNVMCASPERYLFKKDNKIISQPIKGTSKRDPNIINDKILFDKLQQSNKDKTENIMIVDLVRNDLSITANSSSVNVEELCKVYTFNNVHQMISTITSNIDLKRNNFTDIIKTTFPMGSMTGAPKKRAMDLIETFEEHKRGIFSGSIGYITPDGDFDFNVVIRSIIYDTYKKYISISVGGAITISSSEEDEYNECLVKAASMFKALNFNLDA